MEMKKAKVLKPFKTHLFQPEIASDFWPVNRIGLKGLTPNKWRFPKIRVPPNHPFIDGFSILNHPAIGDDFKNAKMTPKNGGSLF